MSLAVGIILSFTAAFAWGTGMVIFKVGVKHTDPLTATYVKGLLAVPILTVIGLIIYGPSSLALPFQGANLLWLILSSVFIALGDFFSLFALRKIDVSIAQPISTIYPIITISLLLVTQTEIITWNIIVGTLLIIIGVATITYFSGRKNKVEIQTVDVSEDSATSVEKKSPILGIILALLAAVFWGANIFFTRKLLEDPDVEVISIMVTRNGLMVAMVIVIAFFYFTIKNKGFKKPQTINYKELGILMGGGIISWCIGGVSFFTAVTMIGAGISTPLSSISPFIVLLLGSIFLKEKIRLPQIIGVAIIVAGSVLLSIAG